MSDTLSEREELDRLDDMLEKAEKQVDSDHIFRFTGIKPAEYLALCDKADHHGEYYVDACYLLKLGEYQQRNST